jgi:hypothetical protein
MSPLRQPRRSVSNAMGAVSSITEDLVAFPSNGGPDRRHLHDGGAPDHQKLELRPRADQNHIRLPQSIPQITRNLNPNGKSQLKSKPSQFLRVSAKAISSSSLMAIPKQWLKWEKIQNWRVAFRLLLALLPTAVAGQSESEWTAFKKQHGLDPNLAYNDYKPGAGGAQVDRNTYVYHAPVDWHNPIAYPVVGAAMVLSALQSVAGTDYTTHGFSLSG